jgi:hypothetical protein
MAAKKKTKRVAKKKTAKKKMMRGVPPRFKPTVAQRDQVRALVGFGLKHDQIASITINSRTKSGIGKATLHKYFRNELDQGGAIAISKVANSLYKKALGTGQGSVAAAIFFLKARAGWSERTEVEISSNTGVLLVPAAMSSDEWVARAEAGNVGREDPTGDDVG